MAKRLFSTERERLWCYRRKLGILRGTEHAILKDGGIPNFQSNVYKLLQQGKRNRLSKGLANLHKYGILVQ